MRLPALDQLRQDLCRFRSTIDVIAEKNLDFGRDGVFCEVGVDARKKLFEQIGAAMDVADGVDPDPIGEIGRRRGGCDLA